MPRVKKAKAAASVVEHLPVPDGEQPAPADWPWVYTAFYAAHPAPVPSAEVSMKRIERHNEEIKAGRERHPEQDDDGHDLGRLEYLRWAAGQHDRQTRWKLGLGTTGGEGGLKA